MSNAFLAVESDPDEGQIQTSASWNGDAELETRGPLPGGCPAVLEFGIRNDHRRKCAACRGGFVDRADGNSWTESMAKDHDQERQSSACEIWARSEEEAIRDGCLEQADVHSERGQAAQHWGGSVAEGIFGESTAAFADGGETRSARFSIAGLGYAYSPASG